MDIKTYNGISFSKIKKHNKHSTTNEIKFYATEKKTTCLNDFEFYFYSIKLYTNTFRHK